MTQPTPPTTRPAAKGGAHVLDLFAGAGGWEQGHQLAGHTGPVTGLETDAVACATAGAAGHTRTQVDVAVADPREFAPVWGLVGSPPCQAYSLAGKGLGRLDRPHVIACAHELAAGHDTRPVHRARCQDPGSLLSVEPLRYALALRPRWVALEQVPPVLELWSLLAQLLVSHGYFAVTGILSAEQHGVPQTRKRAYLIASLDGPVQLPTATHRSYDPRHPDHTPDSERDLEPWVSMARALNWPDPAAVTHTNCHTNSGRRPRGLRRPVRCPARTVDTSAGTWTIDPTHHPRADRRPGHRAARDRRGEHQGWPHRRPATTVLADARIQPPGHKRCAADPPGRYASRAGADAIRLTPSQAGVLQGFPADYPWHGPRSRQFRQIGNAVCPPLVARVITAATHPHPIEGA